MDYIINVTQYKNIRACKGKMYNHCYISCRGLLVVYASDNGIERVFDNPPGSQKFDVSCTNLIHIYPSKNLG